MTHSVPEILARMKVMWPDPHISIRGMSRELRCGEKIIRRIAAENEFPVRPTVINPSSNPWTEAEFDALRKLWADATVRIVDIEAALRRSDPTIRAMAKQLGLPERNRFGRTWTPERLQEMIAMWRDGQTSRQIAAKLDISRNAVIGAIRREFPDEQRVRQAPLKFTPPKASRSVPAKSKLTVVGAPKMAVVQEFPSAPAKTKAWDALPGSTPRPWTDRTARECKWPIDTDEGSGSHSCCLPKAGHDHYCPGHRRLAYFAAQPTKRDLIRSTRRQAAA